MQLGVVVGSVWCTRKEERLVGTKLMIVKPINPLIENYDIQPVVSVDMIGAGIGDKVLIVSGSSARAAAKLDAQIPIDSAIVGIVDDSEVDERYL